jgi:hypothetical protein
MIRKGLICVLFLSWMLPSVIGQACNFKLDALGFSYKPIKVLRVSYEQIFEEKFGVIVTFEQGKYGSFKEIPANSLSGNETTVSSLQGWGLMAEARYYYYIKEGFDPHGLFGGIYYKYRKVGEEYHPWRIKTTALIHNFGLNAGYKYTYTPISFEFLFGYGVPLANWFEPNQRSLIPIEHQFEISNFKSSMRLELTVGVMLDYILRQD